MSFFSIPRLVFLVIMRRYIDLFLCTYFECKCNYKSLRRSRSKSKPHIINGEGGDFLKNFHTLNLSTFRDS